MIAFLMLGLIAGVLSPVQTTVNTRLSNRLGSALLAILISFAVGLIALSLILLLSGDSLAAVPLVRSERPFWIWLGGPYGAIVITLNVLLLPRLGAVQVVILPILGQILMGLVIDQFQLFGGLHSPLTIARAAGAALVILGVILASLEKRRAADKERESNSTSGAALWLIRLIALVDGAFSAAQTATNGTLSKAMGAPIAAAWISFFTGLIFAGVVYLLLRGRVERSGEKTADGRWWIWFGGLLGVVFVFANLFLAQQLGTGLTVIICLVGSILGGIFIDHFGLLGVTKRSVTALRILGLLIMIGGATVINIV